MVKRLKGSNWIWLLLLLLPGCSFLQPEGPPPTSGLRPEKSGMVPTGFDDRARQVESNLGVR